MRGRIVRGCVVVVALILGVGAWAHAQAPTLEIRFSFLAGGRTFDAGSYSVDFGSNGSVVLTPEKGGAAVEVPRLRTLGQRSVRKPELVFDRVGSVMFLSEVWLPEKGGCLVSRADDSQGRETVTGPEVKDKK